MNVNLILRLAEAYQTADDESAKGKICRLILDEASKDFPTPGVSGDPTCEDCGEYLGSEKCCVAPAGKDRITASERDQAAKGERIRAIQTIRSRLGCTIAEAETLLDF